MSVSPINITRVSHNLRTTFVTESLQRTQRDLFTSQARIASGRAFLTPSEDPIAASRALDLTQALERNGQLLANVRHGDNMLVAADSAMSELNDLLTEASVIASMTVGDLTTAAEREAEAEVVTRIRDQLQSVANRTFEGRYLFAGRDTLNRPFIDAVGGIAYTGDLGSLLTRVDEDLMTLVSMPGNLLFGALSSAIVTDTNLTPKLTENVRLDAIVGAIGKPLERGTLVFNEPDGAGVFTVDLSTADTIGDVAALINQAAEAAGSGLTAVVGESGLEITPGGSALVVTDAGTGVVAAGYGILNLQPVTEKITGDPLRARVTRLTPVGELSGGAGIDLENGFVITNGPRSATIDLSSAETVQDIINTLNNADVGVLARVNDDGTGIDIFNQVSGTSLFVGENGGTTASDLGIRTLDTGTPLSQLNFGLGVRTVDGEADLRITAKDGSTVDVNLDGALTIGDVIDLINAAAALQSVSIEAQFAETGNGIRIVDGTGGTGDLTVGRLNLSIAAQDLGLIGTASGTDSAIVGDDVNPTRTEGILGALLDLETALRTDNTQGIMQVGDRIDSLRNEVTRQHGIVGARSQSMTRKLGQAEEVAATTQVFLSEVKDLDFASAATELQSSLALLQANMQTSSNLLNVSLLDFLR